MVDPRRARAALVEHVGPIRVNVTQDEIRLKARGDHIEAGLLAGTEGDVK